MKLAITPQSKLGKWSVGLQSFFIIVIAVSLILVKGLGILDFDDNWWNVTVNVFLASIAALFIGLRAVRKHRDSSVLVYASVFLGFLAILFILLHSLFISD